MREKGIQGDYETLKAADSPRAAEVDNDPRVQAVFAEVQRSTAKMAPTPQSQFFAETEGARTEQRVAQEADDANLNSGQWSGDVWRDKFSDRQRSFFDQRERIKKVFKVEFEDKATPSKSVNAAINDYFDVNVDGYVQPDGTTDWKSFFAAQEDALKPLSGADKTRVMKFIHKYDTPTVTQFRKAQDVVDKFYETPKYKGLSLEDGDKVDKIINETVPRLQLVALRQGTELERRDVIHSLIKQGAIRDPDVVEWFQRNFRRRLRVIGGGRAKILSFRKEEPVSSERDIILLENQELLARFFPDLLQKQLTREQEAGLGEPAFAAVAR